MASQSGHNDTGISSPVELGDLPSKRLLGKGLASIGYETEVNGERFARKDFIGVPSGLFEKEAAVLVELEDHKNIVKTLGWTVDKTSCSLVVEYVDESLLGLLRKRKQSQGRPIDAGDSNDDHLPPPFELPEAVDVMSQIASGMEYLHDHGILHGHLKTKNILVNNCNGNENLLSVKVADFGLVQTKRKSMSFVSRQARKRDMVRWKAPEIIEAELLLSKDRDETSSESDSDESTVDSSLSRVTNWRELSADVYSFALICSQILTGEEPYPNDLNWKEWGANIVAGEVRPTLPAECPPELRTLLNSCWGMISRESSLVRRPTFSYIRRALEHLVALPVRTHSYSSIYDDFINTVIADKVMVVTALINTVIDLTRSVRRTPSYENFRELENLRKQLEVIQVDVVKIEVQLWVLRKKILYMVEQSAYSIDCFSEEQDIVRMVEAWLKTLQHALNLTASELRSAHSDTMSHFLLHLEFDDSTFLMHMKILEHTKEINELAKNREVLALQLKNLLSRYNSGRLQNSERHGQFLLIHQTPSFVFLETLFGLLNARDQEILKEQFRRVLHPIGLRRSMESKLLEKAISGPSAFLPDLPTYASSGRPYSVDRSSYASSGRPHSVDPSSMKHQANQFLSQDFEHPARETPSSSLEFHTSTTAGMGAPHDIRQAMMLDEVEQDPSWLHMEMDASPETGNAIMQDSAIMQQSILSSLTFQGEPVQLLQQATSSRTLHFNPFKEWRRAHVVPRRSEGSTRQWLLHRCFEFLRHIPRVEAQAGSSVQQSFGLSAPRPTSSASSKLLPFAPDEQSFGLSAPRMESISSFNLPPFAPDEPFKLRLSSRQKRLREGASIGTPGHPDYDRAAESYNAQERRRRIKQKEDLSALQELLPIISKSDKVTIIGNAVIHLKNLQKEIDALEANMAELTSQNEKLKLSNQRLQEKNKQLEAMVSGTGPVLNP